MKNINSAVTGSEKPAGTDPLLAGLADLGDGPQAIQYISWKVTTTLPREKVIQYNKNKIDMK